MKDSNKFYYLPDQPKIAYKNGKPQFSFLKYARTDATGKSGTGQAQGGGIVHFLVTYGVSETRINNAEKELQQKYPDAKIVGPITYRKGNFALITSFKEGNEVTTKTVAVGKAPLMEGQKTAVSMALTREGAELLWESFRTDTPDISLVFDMEFSGIREPYEATLEADWSSIAKHDRIQAGFKYKWFGADIDMMFQELRQTGAIKITTKGENAVMDKILESANEKLLKVMFDPVTSDDLTRAAAETGYDSLNQAAKLLKDASSTNKSSSTKTSDIYQDIDNHIKNPLKRSLMSRFFNMIVPSVYAQTAESEIKDQEIEEINEKISVKSVGGSDTQIEQHLTDSANESYNKARRLYEEALMDGFTPEATKKAIEAYEKYQTEYQPTGSRGEEVAGRIRMLKERLKTKEGSTSEPKKEISLEDALTKNIEDLKLPDTEKTPSDDTKKDKTKNTTDSEKDSGFPDLKDLPPLPTPSTANQTKSKTGTSTNTTSSSSKPKTTAQKAKSDGFPGFSLVASYKMKKIKRSGKMVYNMNNYRTETQAFAMAENIGDIFKKYGKDPKVFRAITIDDPVFKQREIMVTLDGQDASTFTKYLNFVTVKMKKQHQGGEITTGEIVITPETFNTAGNNFSMVYGWKDDSDRTKWLSYEYQTIWSFYGGFEIRTPWTKTDSPMLALMPPYHYRTVSIEGDGDTLNEEEVRHGVVTFSCKVGDKYISQQVTIKNKGPAPSMILDIPEDSNNPETSVDITWYLTKSRKLASEKTLQEGDILYWDELPKGGI